MEATVEVSFGTEGAPTGRGYEVRIGPETLAHLGSELEWICPAHRYVIIADRRVADLYGERVSAAARESGRPVDLLVFPDGEANKNREVWADLSDRMLALGVGRDAAVLALGGGVTGDLAGFVAATYLRGLPLVQLPTSLLAMIDSSVGGKTGVDTHAGKNLIGAFHQPVAVIADTDTLHTLPIEQLRSGVAEGIKHGAIADTTYFAWIGENREKLLSLSTDTVIDFVRRSVEIKADVVGRDEREGGLRKVLNFGHTIGHAIEAASRFELLHGEAIAIGMVAESLLGELVGITEEGTADRLKEVIAPFGLPTRIPAKISLNDVLGLTRTDKKARAGKVEYSLIERIGEASVGSGAYGVPIDDDPVRSVLARLH